MTDVTSDYLAIHAVYCALLDHLDERRFDPIKSLWLPDAVLRMYLTRDDRDAGRPMAEMTDNGQIVEGYRNFFTHLDATHHGLSNFVTDVDGDRAKVSAHLRCYHRGTGQSEGLWQESLALMTGEAARTEEGIWRIASMEYTIAISLGSLSVFGDLG